MAAVAVEEMKAAERAHLSREINRALELHAQIREREEELKAQKDKLFQMVSQQPGTYRSNKGFVEIRSSSRLGIPSHAEAGLREVLGDRFETLVEESVSLKVKPGLRRLLFEPGPAEKMLSQSLREFVTVSEQVSFTFKGAT